MGSEVDSFALPGGGKRLEFRGSGARTCMVDVDASGKMVRATQVLTPESRWRRRRTRVSQRRRVQWQDGGMRTRYEVGFRLGKEGDPWFRQPPGQRPDPQVGMRGCYPAALAALEVQWQS
jgi:hypothetical protein